MRAVLAVLLVMWLCACRDDPTQIIVSVDTNYDLGHSPLAIIRYRVKKHTDREPDQIRFDQTEPVAMLTRADFPRTVDVRSSKGDELTIRVEVEGFDSEDALKNERPLVRHLAIASFVRGKVLVLPVNLYRECEHDQMCAEAAHLTCGAGGKCEPIERGRLDAWTGEAPRISDGGISDIDDAGAGRADAGHNTDAGQSADGGADAGPAPDDVAGIAVGKYHSCAWTVAGVAYCWGGNVSGELGAVSTDKCTAPDVTGEVACSITPLRVSVLDDLPQPARVRQVAAGEGFTCGLLTDGTVHCWGSDAVGQRGDGSVADPNAYHAVVHRPDTVDVTLQGVAEIAAGRGFACARVAQGGAVYCWGANGLGQLGAGMAVDGSRAVASEVTGAMRLWAGWYDACALKAREVVCWGSNENAQLAMLPSSLTQSPDPVTIANEAWEHVSPGDSHVCALRGAALAGDPLVCWGHAQYAELGIGDPSGLAQGCSDAPGAERCSTTPLAPQDLPATPVAVSAGSYASCALLADSRLVCWGGNDYGVLAQEPTKIQEAFSPVLVRRGGADFTGTTRLPPSFFGHICVQRGPRELWCWGDDKFGATGERTKLASFSSAPFRVTLPTE